MLSCFLPLTVVYQYSEELIPPPGCAVLYPAGLPYLHADFLVLTLIVALRLEDVALLGAVHSVDLRPLLTESDGEHRENDRDQKAGLNVGDDRRCTSHDPHGLKFGNLRILKTTIVERAF